MKKHLALFSLTFMLILLLTPAGNSTAQAELRSYGSVLRGGYRIDFPADWWLAVQTQLPWEGLLLTNTETAFNSQLEGGRTQRGDILVSVRVADREIVDRIADNQSIDLEDLLLPSTQAFFPDAEFSSDEIEETSLNGRQVFEANSVSDGLAYFTVIAEWENGFVYALAIKAGGRLTDQDAIIVRNIITSVRPQNPDIDTVSYLSDLHELTFERPTSFEVLSETASFIETSSENATVRLSWTAGESLGTTVDNLADFLGVRSSDFERDILDGREIAFAYADLTGTSDDWESLVILVSLHPTAFGLFMLSSEDPEDQLGSAFEMVSSMEVAGRRVRDLSLRLDASYDAGIANYSFDYPNEHEWSVSTDTDDSRSILPRAFMELAIPMLMLNYQPNQGDGGSIVFFIPPVESELGTVMSLSTDLIIEMMLESAPTVASTVTETVLVSGRLIQLRDIEMINDNQVILLTVPLSDARIANMIVQGIELDTALAIAASLRVQGETSPYQAVASPSPSPTSGPSPTPTQTFTPTATFTPSNTPTATDTPTITPTASDTATPSDTPTASNTPTPSITPTPSNTPTSTYTPTHTATSTFTASPTLTPTLVHCEGSPASRLYPGDRGRVTATQSLSNRVRSAPTRSGETVGYLEPLEEFDVLDGPLCAEGYAWYRVQSGRLEGWTAEGVEGDYWIEPVGTSNATAIPEDSCVAVADGLTNMRSGPGTSYNLVGQLADGDSVLVTGKQYSSEGFLWWQLANGGWVRSDVVAIEGDCSLIPDLGD